MVFEFFKLIPFIIGVVAGTIYIMLGGRGSHDVIYKYPHPTTVDALVSVSYTHLTLPTKRIV